MLRLDSLLSKNIWTVTKWFIGTPKTFTLWSSKHPAHIRWTLQLSEYDSTSNKYKDVIEKKYVDEQTTK